MLELVQPEDPEQRLIPEDEGKAVYLQYNKHPRGTWEEVFEPIKDENFRQRMIDLYKVLDKDE